MWYVMVIITRYCDLSYAISNWVIRVMAMQNIQSVQTLYNVINLSIF